MNADEIVRALRCEHGHLTNHGRDFMLNYTREEFFKILNESADLIESLQADLRHEEKISHGQMEQNKRLRKMMDKLQANLADSQRRERAAVEDLNGTGACFTCKHFRRNGGDCFGAGRCRLDGIEIWPCNEPGVYRVEVPDDGRKTYEWRGHQEAGKGETK